MATQNPSFTPDDDRPRPMPRPSPVRAPGACESGRRLRRLTIDLLIFRADTRAFSRVRSAVLNRRRPLWLVTICLLCMSALPRSGASRLSAAGSPVSVLTNRYDN